MAARIPRIIRGDTQRSPIAVPNAAPVMLPIAYTAVPSATAWPVHCVAAKAAAEFARIKGRIRRRSALASPSRRLQQRRQEDPAAHVRQPRHQAKLLNLTHITAYLPDSRLMKDASVPLPIA